MRSDDPDPMNLKAGVLIMSDASVQQLEAATLRARVAELEEALQRIVDLPYNGHGYSLVIARAALEERT